MSNRLKTKLGQMYPALTHRSFQYFWIGQLISFMGTWIQRTAQQWLVYTMTKSAFLLGILGVAQFDPMLLFSLFAGILVDLFPKKKVLIITQLAFMIQALLLAALVWKGNVKYWEIIILAAVFGFLNTLDKPCRQSFFLEIVERKDLPNAIALNSSVSSLAKISGPAIAAILMAKYGASFCFFLNGISYIPVIVGLGLIITSGIRFYPMVVFLVINIGLFNNVFLTAVNSSIQLNSTQEYRGRVMSVYSLGNNGMTPVGNFFAGSVMEVFGASVGLFICGAVSGILVVILIIKKRVYSR